MDRWRSLSNIQKGAIVGVLALILIGTIVTITVLATRNATEAEVHLTKTDKSSEIVNNLNKSARPCEDFYAYACGNYKKQHPVKSQIQSSNYFLAQDTQVKNNSIDKLLKDVAKEKETAPEAYIRALFKKCIADNPPDDLEKFKSKVNEVLGNEKESFIKTMAKVNRLGLPSVVGVAVLANPFNSTQHIFTLGPPAAPGSSLEKIFEKLRKAKAKSEDPEAPIKKLILDSLKVFYGKDEDDNIKKEADEILKTSKQLAEKSKYQPPPELEKRYKNYTLEELSKVTGDGFNWKEYLETLVNDENVKIDDKENITAVISEDYLKQLPNLVKEMKKEITNYLRWSLIMELGFVVSPKFREVEWNYQKSQLEKIKEPTTEDVRKKFVNDKCYATIDNAGDIVARIYVDESAKKDIENGKALVESIKASFATLIQKKEWMDEETKQRALYKLGNITVNVGHPDWLSDNKKLEEKYSFLKKEDLTDKATLSDLAFKFREGAIADSFKSLRKPVDLSQEWPISPMLTNAVYSPTQNTITIPISILRGIFFNKDNPKYMNYAQLGSIIGHELTHAFDTTGSQTDEHGNIANWWSKKTHEEFEKLTKCLVDQYSKDKYNVTNPKNNKTEEMNVDGSRTLGENIADNGGVREAFKAWDSARKDKVEEKLEGLDEFTEEQLFFISYANNWCSDEAPPILFSSLLNDEHSPSRSRVNDVLANFDSFAHAFKCEKNTPMNPDSKCKVW